MPLTRNVTYYGSIHRLYYGYGIYIAQSKHKGFGEFDTVIQTQDRVEGLHNSKNSSNLPCAYMRLCKQEKSSLLFKMLLRNTLESKTSQLCFHVSNKSSYLLFQRCTVCAVTKLKEILALK